MNIRIIPRLDIKGPNLVKGIHLEGLRVLGKPERFARHYYENGADELIYMDVVASLYQRNSLIPIIEKTSKEIFIPLTVGGGLRTLDDIRSVLRAGADKVSLNTAVIHNPLLIKEAAKKFGSSTILVSIEAIKKQGVAVAGEPFGKGLYECYTDNGRERTGRDAFEWAVQAAELGAGEIMVTSIDREGTGMGFDLELTRKIAESVPVPVIACGGAGALEHVSDVILNGKADAVSCASIFHYHCVEHNPVEDDFSAEGNIEYLSKKSEKLTFTGYSILEVKEHLAKCGISYRQSLSRVIHE